MSSLIEELEEQIIMGFTGKVNVLSSENSQHIGVIFIKEGVLVNCIYRGAKGKSSLLELMLKDFDDNKNLKYISEPEIIPNDDSDFDILLEDLVGELSGKKKSSENKKKLRPPKDLKLLIDGNFILDGEEVTPLEFDLLKTISDYNKVDDIYENAKMLESEITDSLVTLRKKKSLKVIGK